MVTNDAAIDQRLRLLRDYGQERKYHHVAQGYNHRLDTIQAAVLRVKLPLLDEWNTARRAHAKRYAQALHGSAVSTPTVPDYAEPVWHLYVIESDVRDALRTHLAEQGIATGMHYPVPIHLQVAYRALGYEPGAFPVTERAADRILSLPMYAELTDGQIDQVAAAIKAFELAPTVL